MHFYTLRLAQTHDAEPIYLEEIDAVDDDVAAMWQHHSCFRAMLRSRYGLCNKRAVLKA